VTNPDPHPAPPSACAALDDAGLAPDALALLGDDGIALLRVAPVVHLAWLLGGDIGHEERSTVLAAARTRGLAPATRAHRVLEGWLVERPSEEYFAAALSALKGLLPTLSIEEQVAIKHDLVAYLLFLDRAALDVRARRALVGVGRGTRRGIGAQARRGEERRKLVG